MSLFTWVMFAMLGSFAVGFLTAWVLVNVLTADDPEWVDVSSVRGSEGSCRDPWAVRVVEVRPYDWEVDDDA